MGAGFGGCLVAFVKRRLVETFAASVGGTYHRAWGQPPEVYPMEAAAGAGLVPA